MDETRFNKLNLTQKADFVQENGQFIEAQDFYSFFILAYLLNQHKVNLLYDFTGLLVSVEWEEDSGENYLSNQLQSSLCAN